MQTLRGCDRCTLLVTFRIILRRAHVPLGVDAVVIPPIRNRAACNTNLERLTMRERITRHETTVAPAPQSNSRTINIRLRLEPRKAIFQVAKFQLAKVLVDGPG